MFDPCRIAFWLNGATPENEKALLTSVKSEDENLRKQKNECKENSTDKFIRLTDSSVI